MTFTHLSGRLRRRRAQPTPAAVQRSSSAREPACADTDIRKSARDHYLANKLFVLLSKNIRLRRRALAARSPSRHGLAHANRFPAAGRLMRAGRAGAGGGSDACAHRRPSLSAGMQSLRSERDDNNSLSQRRLVNTNRSRSRDKIFDLHFTTHTSACADRVATAPHTCALLANCSRPPPRRRRAAGDILQFFQKTDMHRHRGRGAPACHVAATQHYHRPPTTVGDSTPHTDYTTF